jgi:hypothetical protein
VVLPQQTQAPAMTLMQLPEVDIKVGKALVATQRMELKLAAAVVVVTLVAAADVVRFQVALCKTAAAVVDLDISIRRAYRSLKLLTVKTVSPVRLIQVAEQAHST